MAKEAVSPDRLDNVKKAAADSARRVEALKAERVAINEDIASIRADMVTKGIPKAAFDMALRYAGWDEDKRAGFDTAYSIVREALGLPVDAQGDLFAEMGAVPPADLSGQQDAFEQQDKATRDREERRARTEAEIEEGDTILKRRGRGEDTATAHGQAIQ